MSVAAIYSARIFLTVLESLSLSLLARLLTSCNAALIGGRTLIYETSRARTTGRSLWPSPPLFIVAGASLPTHTHTQLPQAPVSPHLIHSLFRGGGGGGATENGTTRASSIRGAGAGDASRINSLVVCADYTRPPLAGANGQNSILRVEILYTRALYYILAHANGNLVHHRRILCFMLIIGLRYLCHCLPYTQADLSSRAFHVAALFASAFILVYPKVERKIILCSSCFGSWLEFLSYYYYTLLHYYYKCLLRCI